MQQGRDVGILYFFMFPEKGLSITIIIIIILKTDRGMRRYPRPKLRERQQCLPNASLVHRNRVHTRKPLQISAGRFLCNAYNSQYACVKPCFLWTASGIQSLISLDTLQRSGAKGEKAAFEFISPDINRCTHENNHFLRLDSAVMAQTPLH